jgi:hypothetical protein
MYRSVQFSGSSLPQPTPQISARSGWPDIQGQPLSLESKQGQTESRASPALTPPHARGRADGKLTCLFQIIDISAWCEMAFFPLGTQFAIS